MADVQSGGPPRQEDGLRRSMRHADDRLRGQQKSPLEAIRRMRLPKAKRVVLAPLFSDLGFELIDDKVELRYAFAFEVNFVRSHEEQRVLLHIPKSVLEGSSQQKDVLSCLPWSFKGFPWVYVLSEEVEAIKDPEWSDILLVDWPRNMGINVIFIPWSHIEALEESGLPQDQRHRRLRRVFRLADPGNMPQDVFSTRYLYDRPFLVALREKLAERFSTNELRLLCYDLDVDFEDLRGETKEDKTLALVELAERRRFVKKLLETGKKLRSDISWDKIG